MFRFLAITDGNIAAGFTGLVDALAWAEQTHRDNNGTHLRVRIRDIILGEWVR
jgi:hypothetical protein